MWPRIALALALLPCACRTPEVSLESMHGAEAADLEPRRPLTEPIEQAPKDVAESAPGASPAIEAPIAQAAPVEPTPFSATAAQARVAPADESLARARAALDAGELALARDLIEERLTSPQVTEARSLLDAGRPEEALAVAEGALEVAPGNPDVRLLCGEASLQVGTRQGDATFFEAALRDFLLAGRSAPALLGASRAARAMGRMDEALRHARAGMVALAERRSPANVRWVELPERTLSEAAFAAAMAAKRADAPEATALFAEAEDALSRLMARTADDPWVWAQLASLYLEDGRNHDAQQALERGLDRSPSDPRLPGLLAKAARALSGAEGVQQAFARLQKKHPDAALAWWFPAVERFEGAMAKLAEAPLQEFHAAEADFRHCRELDAQYAAGCLGYEAVCRDALGWCALQAGDLVAARTAFLSMEDLFHGGMGYELNGRLGSGVKGLAAVGDALYKRNDLPAAAEAFLALHRYEPENVIWANNTGLFHRDAGERTRLLGADFLRAAKGELKDGQQLATLRAEAGLDASLAGTAQERAAFQRAGEEHEERARAMFETSYAAYLAAASLAPDDVRILNDAALIAVYHLGRDLERAEELLRRAVELGAKQLEDETLDEEARLALREAWGDAHQNLGVLYLEHKQDPEAARVWFEKSLEIGPSPRAVVSEHYLPRCRAVRPSGSKDPSKP